MSQPSPLESLAEQISSSAKTITSYCQANGLPEPSLDNANTTEVLPPSAPEHVKVAQQTVVDAALKIQQLTVESNQFVPRLAVHFQHLSCLRWLCHFRILSFVPLDGSISFADLAAAATVPEPQLRSVARMAMTAGVFREPVSNHVAHSRTSAHLLANPSLTDWILFMAEASAPMAAKLVEATEKWGDTVQKTETAFNIAMDTDKPFFDYLSASPHLTKRFAGYMKNVMTSDGTNVRHLLNGFDWAGLGEAKVVDVGGSKGHASIALAGAHPKLNFVVQDLPDVINTSKTDLTTLPEDVAKRISFQEHNFFSPQVVTDADVYLLRMILHDWPAKEATVILSNLLPALQKPGARIILMDTVLPAPGSASVSDEALLRVRDMTMMETFNSHERDLADWNELLAKASPGLKLKVAKQPFGSAMAVMEVAYEGEAADDSKGAEAIEVVPPNAPSAHIPQVVTAAA